MTHRIALVRHGQTEWSKSGQHTSTTDIDLTDEGVHQAMTVPQLLWGVGLAPRTVWSSPRLRARRTAALAASTRRGAKQLSTAEEKICEAVNQLDRIDDIKKAAGSIHKSAEKIETGCTAVTSGINRLLSEALAALADAQASEDPSTDTSGDTAA